MGSTLNIYFASKSMGYADLAGNAMLAEAISDLSDRRYCCVLPQNFPTSQKSDKDVFDNNLKIMLECDLALFASDRAAPDADAILQFAAAKFADMPCVLLQTAAAEPGNARDGWDSLAVQFPRTEIEALDSLAIYEGVFKEFPMTDAEDVLIEERSSEVARTMIRVIAQAVVDAFDRVVEVPSIMPSADASAIFRWLGCFNAPGSNAEQTRRAMRAALARKQDRGMLEAPAARCATRVV